VPITTEVRLNAVHDSIQHYVIKFVSNLQQVSGFLLVSSTNNTDRHVITEILLEVALSTITPTHFEIFATFT